MTNELGNLGSGQSSSLIEMQKLNLSQSSAKIERDKIPSFVHDLLKNSTARQKFLNNSEISTKELMWFTQVKSNSFLTKRSMLAKVCSLGIYAVWAYCIDKGIIKNVEKLQQEARVECAKRLALGNNENLDLNDFNVTNQLKHLLPDLLNAAIQFKNIKLINKCWEIIPIDQIDIFLDALESSEIPLNNQGGEGKSILHAAVENRRWELVNELMKRGIGNNEIGEGKSPLELFLLQENLDPPAITSALNALYNNQWDFDEKIALTVLKKYPSFVSELSKKLLENKDFWIKASEINKLVILHIPSKLLEIDHLWNHLKNMLSIKDMSLEKEKNISIEKKFWQNALLKRGIEAFKLLPEYLHEDKTFWGLVSQSPDFWVDMLRGGVSFNAIPDSLCHSANFWRGVSTIQESSKLFTNIIWLQALQRGGLYVLNVLPLRVNFDRNFWSLVKANLPPDENLWANLLSNGSKEVLSALPDSLRDKADFWNKIKYDNGTDNCKSFWIDVLKKAGGKALDALPEIYSNDKYFWHLLKVGGEGDLSNDFWIDMLHRKNAYYVVLPERLDTMEFWADVLKRDEDLIRFLPKKYHNSSFWIKALSKHHDLKRIFPKEFDNDEFWKKGIAEKTDLIEIMPNQYLIDHNFWIYVILNSNDFESKIKHLPNSILTDINFWTNPEFLSNSEKNIQLTKFLPQEILNLPEFKEKLAFQKLKAFRRKVQFQNKMKNISSEDVAKQKSEKYDIPINKRVREPLINLTKTEDWVQGQTPIDEARRAVTKAAKLGTYEKFRTALRTSFEDTLQSIYACPPEDQEYVILADIPGKSTNWVMAHLHDMMSVHPPKNIISRDKLEAFLKENPNIKHIVMVDDGVYSAQQASSYISGLKGLTPQQTFHVTIPYTTSFGKQKISEVLQKKGCKFQMHDKQTMHSYQELTTIGNIFSYTGRILVDNSPLSKIEMLPNDENLDIKKEINDKLAELKGLGEKLGEFKKNNESESKIKGAEKLLYEKILEAMSLINKHCKITNHTGTKLSAEGMKLIELLRSAIKTEKRSEAQAKEFQMAYGYMETRKTASWFAHKGADDASTNQVEMLSIVGDKWPIEPYKVGDTYTKSRKAQIEVIKTKMGERTLEKTVIEQGSQEWLSGRIDFVHTNRGFFLLGNSYLEETSAHPLILHKKDKNSGKDIIIQLGGNEGEYQYKLTEGEEFFLEDPISHRAVKLKLDESGALRVIP